MAPLLSICIPTWNRKKELGRLLKNISGEAKGVEGQVEVCVSNNGSTDGTKEYLESAKNAFGFPISVFNSEKNVGFDANILRAMRMGKGKWIWTMGDDDLVNAGQLKALLSSLENMEGKVCVVYPNYQYVDIVKKRSREPCENEETLKSRDTSAGHLVLSPEPFISRVIVRKDLFDAIGSRIEKFVGSVEMYMWVQRYIGLQNPQCKIRYLPEVVVINTDVLTRETRLSEQMVHAYSAHKNYLLFWSQNLLNPDFYRFPRFPLKVFTTLFFPLLHVTCERAFRREPEKIPFSRFLKTSILLGPIWYAYRTLLWLVPRGAAAGMLKLLAGGKGYGRWEGHWIQDEGEVVKGRSWLGEE